MPSTPIPCARTAPVSSFSSEPGTLFNPVTGFSEIHQGAAAAPNDLPPVANLNIAGHLASSGVNNLTSTTTTHRSLTNSLPPLPQNILDQIKAGKFVKFDDLLPTISLLSPDDYALTVTSARDDEPTVSLVPHRQSRPRVIDFYTWCTAWNSYLQAMAYFHPTRLSELIAYQSMITRYACQYSFSAWFTYDRLFRHTMANNPALSWAQSNDNLFNRYLQGAPLCTLCYSCRNYGHMSTNCPLRPTSSASPRQQPTNQSNSPTILARQQPPFRAPQIRSAPPSQPRLTCRYFNAGQCSSSYCQFPHHCRSCYGNHPQIHCRVQIKI